MIGRVLGLPLSSSIVARLFGSNRDASAEPSVEDLPATPDPRQTIQKNYAAMAAVAVPVVVATAGTHLGPGVTGGDVVALCVAYLLATVATLWVPWRRLDERWLLVLVGIPVVFVASLSAVTGAGASPYSALYAPILAVAGWHLPARHALAAIGLVVVTEAWRAIAMDRSGSIEQLAVVLPFDVAVAAVAFIGGNSLRGALSNTRREQVRMAATLDAIRELGSDPQRSVFADLERAMAKVFDAEVRVIRFDSRRPEDIDLTATLLEPSVATVLVPGASTLYGVARLVTTSQLSEHEVRLASILAEVAGRTEDARQASADSPVVSDRDPLTGLRNRRALDRDLSVAVESRYEAGGQLALLVVDIDGFKKLNDQYGHAAGDVVILRTATILRGCARRDEDVYRYGGNQFAVVQPQGGRMAAFKVARRILNMTSNPGRRKGDPLTPTFAVSIGIALSRPEWSPADLLAAADSAIDEAKRAGGATIRIDRRESAGVPDR